MKMGDLVDSVEAARILRAHPHDPLAYRRLDALRATGRLKPVATDQYRGPRYDRLEVEALARPWEVARSRAAHPSGQEDPLAAARGLIYGLGLGTVLLAVIVAVVWWVLR